MNKVEMKGRGLWADPRFYEISLKLGNAGTFDAIAKQRSAPGNPLAAGIDAFFMEYEGRATR